MALRITATLKNISLVLLELSTDQYSYFHLRILTSQMNLLKDIIEEFEKRIPKKEEE